MEPDEALQLLGKYSRWQIRIYLIYAIGFGIPFAWMMTSIVFIGDTPNYRCALPPNATLNETIPLAASKDGTMEYAKCEMYRDLSVSNETIPCTHGYWYDPASGYESTISTEWDLVCGLNWLVELSMTINSIGAALGSLVFTRLSDLYGRKKVFLGCLWSNIIIAVIQSFSPNYTFYVVLGFLDGFQQQGMVSAAMVLGMELFPTEQRTFAGLAVEFFWAFGYITLTPFAYYIRNWRYFQLSITVPLLLTFVFYWGVEESIPWLVAKGRVKEADALMRKAAKFNGITLPEKIFDDPELSTPLRTLQTDTAKETKESNVNGAATETLLNNESAAAETNCNSENRNNNASPIFKFPKFWQKKKERYSVTDSEDKKYHYGVIDIFKSSILRRYTLVLFYIWFMNGLGYYSINLTVTYLPGNRYLNFFLYAVLELPAYAMAWVFLHFIGRRLPLAGFHIVCGIALLCTIVQTMECCSDITWLVVTFSMLGKFCITASFATIYVNTPELYPTKVRNLGLGMGQFSSRVAIYIGPYARVLHRFFPWLPPLIIGGMSFVAGILTLTLPETRHTPLPNSIEEAEKVRRTRFCDCSRPKKSDIYVHDADKQDSQINGTIAS